MNKTTCCGCAAFGCALVIVAVIVGGYYGVNFLYDSGKSLAAEGLRESVDRLTKVAFEEKEKKEIMLVVDETVMQIKDGKIGLGELFKEGTRQLESNLHVKTLLLGFARKATKEAMQSGDKPAAELDQAQQQAINIAMDSVERAVFGMMENKISAGQVASITASLVEYYTEKVSSEDGKSTTTHSFKRLKTDFTPEEIVETVNMLQKLCEKNGVPEPDSSFDAFAAVKNEIISIFQKLNSKGN